MADAATNKMHAITLLHAPYIPYSILCFGGDPEGGRVLLVYNDYYKVLSTPYLIQSDYLYTATLSCTYIRH